MILKTLCIYIIPRRCLLYIMPVIEYHKCSTRLHAALESGRNPYLKWCRESYIFYYFKQCPFAFVFKPKGIPCFCSQNNLFSERTRRIYQNIGFILFFILFSQILIPLATMLTLMPPLNVKCSGSGLDTSFLTSSHRILGSRGQSVVVEHRNTKTRKQMSFMLNLNRNRCIINGQRVEHVESDRYLELLLNQHLDNYEKQLQKALQRWCSEINFKFHVAGGITCHV